MSDDDLIWRGDAKAWFNADKPAVDRRDLYIVLDAVRAAIPAVTPAIPEPYERAMRLVEALANPKDSWLERVSRDLLLHTVQSWTDEARAIVASAKPVDADLLEARRIWAEYAVPKDRIIDGEYDGSSAMLAIRAALKRSRELVAQERGK